MGSFAFRIAEHKIIENMITDTSDIHTNRIEQLSKLVGTFCVRPVASYDDGPKYDLNNSLFSVIEFFKSRQLNWKLFRRIVVVVDSIATGQWTKFLSGDITGLLRASPE